MICTDSALQEPSLITNDGHIVIGKDSALETPSLINHVHRRHSDRYRSSNESLDLISLYLPISMKNSKRSISI